MLMLSKRERTTMCLVFGFGLGYFDSMMSALGVKAARPPYYYSSSMPFLSAAMGLVFFLTLAVGLAAIQRPAMV